MMGKPRKGMMGIGALIIFIAIILIAAVAASVLITTGGSLQQKALITGTQTEEAIASGIEVMTVVASDASSTDPILTPHMVGEFKITTRLQSGSQGLNLNNTLITVDTETASSSLTFNTTVASDTTSVSTTTYLVFYIQEGTNHEDGYINRGDVAKIIIHVEPEISENQLVRIKLIPRIGTYTQLEFYTSDSMTSKSIVLWPT
ncbi:MAG: archaellin/type IV pilin N-terminal domain-containing protein [Candidatus Altiarchaeota archaeon]